MSKFKPGDLAIVVRESGKSQIAGRIVEIVAFHGVIRDCNVWAARMDRKGICQTGFTLLAGTWYFDERTIEPLAKPVEEDVTDAAEPKEAQHG
jgi:hypothetical protein